MNKKFFLASIFLLLLFPALANALDFSLGGSLTVRAGHQGEYVFEPLSHDRLLSYLEWDEKPLFIVGLSGSAGYKNFKLEAGANVAFPTESGIVKDLDYMNVADFPSCPDSIAEILTYYTESLCRTNALYSFNFQLSYTFNFNPVFSLAPFLGYDFQHSDQSAWGLDGFYYDIDNYRESNGYYGWYYTEGHTIKKYRSKNVEVLSLERDYHTSWLGLAASFNLSDKVTLTANAAISPYSAIQSLDSHLLRGKLFFDDTHSWFAGGKASLSLDYKIDLHNRLFARIDFFATGRNDGMTYSANIGSSKYTANMYSHAGADLQTWDFTLGYRYCF